ncbi:MAG: hypothetical protein EP343_20575 [Deltaproteobacteria bacterium]|nr:MAG: hypothetical protein EP343_20575 [Deltaproteobacteria bacterium]
MDSSRHNLLREALHYLDLAIEAYVEALRERRLKALWSWLLRPGALVLALLSVTSLAAIFYAMGVRGTLCFTLGVLCYMVPLLIRIWRDKRPLLLEPFWAEVHRSDEVMAQLADRELLLWPSLHPEELWDKECSPEELVDGILARQQQLQAALQIKPTDSEEVT